MSLVEALVHSVKTGVPVTFACRERNVRMVVGMIDCHSEPWNRQAPVFYGYEVAESEPASEEEGSCRQFIGSNNRSGLDTFEKVKTGE